MPGYHVKYILHAAVGPTSRGMTDAGHRMTEDEVVAPRIMSLRPAPACVEDDLKHQQVSK